jgi:copper chaperone
MTTLRITGMTCGHCAMKAEKALSAVPGVRSAGVDLASGLAQVEGDALQQALVSAVEAEGFGAAVA